MRIFFYTVLALIVVSCNDQPGMETPSLYTGAQARLLSIVDTFSARINEAPNDAQKSVLKDSCVKTIGRFLMDSTKLHELLGFYVKIGSVQTTPWNGGIALTVDASDDKFKYWMEVDYKSSNLMLADSAYKTVIKLKEGEQRKVNMFFMREVEQEIGYIDHYKVRVVFLPDSP